MKRIEVSIALLCCLVTYCLIVLGGWVRASDAGLSCPDWPTCYGRWVLFPEDFAALGDVGYTYFQMMLEWTHRLMAGVILGPLILIYTLIKFAGRKDDPPGSKLGLALLVLLLIQASLGGITVFDQNSPWSVALHKGTALVIFALLILAFRRAQGLKLPAVPAIVPLFTVMLVVIAYGAIITAAITAKSGASLACDQWPSCDGSFFPALDDPQIRIHFIHRGLAAVTGLGILLLLAMTILVSSMARFRIRALIAATLVLLQISMGAVLIVLELPSWSQVGHQAIGVLLFATLVELFWISNLSQSIRSDNGATDKEPLSAT